jgi:GAF domain-containing protein
VHWLASAAAADILQRVAAADVWTSLEKISAETTVSRLLHVASAELAAHSDAARVSVSRVIGDLLVELSNHDRDGLESPLELFLVTDYPLTQEVIEAGEPRVVLRGAPDADPAEANLLERLGFASLLMLPLRSRGQNWGLVEIYSDEDGSSEQEIATATAIVESVGDRLVLLESRV